MAIDQITPLDLSAPIVDPATGMPLPQFVIFWQQIFGNQENVDELVGTKADASTTITAGTGLSGGGSLAADRTIDLEDTAVTPGSYTSANITVDQQGRLTAAASNLVAAPATASSTGTAGQWAYDSSYLYVCVAADTWLRVAIATW